MSKKLPSQTPGVTHQHIRQPTADEMTRWKAAAGRLKAKAESIPAKLEALKLGYEAASTDGERAFYMLSALNMCVGRPLPRWLHHPLSEIVAAQLPPVPQKELALVFGYKQLRAEYEAEGVSGYQAEVKAAKALGFYRKGKDPAVTQERAVAALRRTLTRYREKLRRKPGKRKRY